MAEKKRTKKLFINKRRMVNIELFDDVRLTRGLSYFQLAIELQISHQTVLRVFTVGSDPRPITVKKIGEYLGIPPKDWYVPRENTPDDTQ